MREPEFVILRQLLKTSGDVQKGRHLAADPMPGALTQDPTSMAMTPERRLRQAETDWVDPAQGLAGAGPPGHVRSVLPSAIQSFAGVHGVGRGTCQPASRR